MGCIFSKPRSAKIVKSQPLPTNDNDDIHHTNEINNGILRVPKLNSEGGTVTQNGHGHQMANGHSDAPLPKARRGHSPHRTLVDTHTSKDVANAERGDNKTSSETTRSIQSIVTNSAKGHQQSSLTVSDVNFKSSPQNSRRSTSIKTGEELSVEDLDTDLDTYQTLSLKPQTSGRTINIPTTEILLPKRKVESPKPRKKPIITERKHVTVIDSNEKEDPAKNINASRKDTPVPQNFSPATKGFSKVFAAKTEEMIMILEDNEIEDLVEADEPNDKLGSKNNEGITGKCCPYHGDLKVNNQRNDNAGDTIDGKFGRLTEHNKTQDESLPNIRARQNISDKTTTDPLPTPRLNYEKELEKKRQTRKRKRGSATRTENTPGKLNETDNTIMLPSRLQRRPDSTDSNTTLNSFHLDPNPAQEHHDQYSYIQCGSTPISFRDMSVDTEVDLCEAIDAEADRYYDINHETVDRDKHIDGWYGVKPYNVFTSENDKHTGIIREINSGADGERQNVGSGVKSTKTKLLYSRFSHRPHSEILQRDLGKPPLPPDAYGKIRPVSDTGRRIYPSGNF